MINLIYLKSKVYLLTNMYNDKEKTAIAAHATTQSLVVVVVMMGVDLHTKKKPPR